MDKGKSSKGSSREVEEHGGRVGNQMDSSEDSQNGHPGKVVDSRPSDAFEQSSGHELVAMSITQGIIMDVIKRVTCIKSYSLIHEETEYRAQEEGLC